MLIICALYEAKVMLPIISFLLIMTVSSCKSRRNLRHCLVHHGAIAFLSSDSFRVVIMAVPSAIIKEDDSTP